MAGKRCLGGVEIWLLEAITTTMVEGSSSLTISFSCWQWSRPVAVIILAFMVSSGGGAFGPSPVSELDAITSTKELRCRFGDGNGDQRGLIVGAAEVVDRSCTSGDVPVDGFG
jgi:hypothetical protein